MASSQNHKPLSKITKEQYKRTDLSLDRYTEIYNLAEFNIKD